MKKSNVITMLSASRATERTFLVTRFLEGSVPQRTPAAGIVAPEGIQATRVIGRCLIPQGNGSDAYIERYPTPNGVFGRKTSFTYVEESPTRASSALISVSRYRALRSTQCDPKRHPLEWDQYDIWNDDLLLNFYVFAGPHAGLALLKFNGQGDYRSLVSVVHGWELIEVTGDPRYAFHQIALRAVFKDRQNDPPYFERIAVPAAQKCA